MENSNIDIIKDVNDMKGNYQNRENIEKYENQN